MPVRAGLRLEVRLRPEALRATRLPGDSPVAIGADRILFEDDVLIAIDKPPGLPTQPTVDPDRPSLYGLVKELLQGRGSGGVYLGLHQRLDRDTSGVVLFTKAAEVNRAVAALFSERRVEKTYRALTARPARLPARAWSVAGRLEVAGRGREGRPRPVATGGVTARTGFRLLEALPDGLLVEARPVTGRKHQIRVHLATAGMPILGDTLHGGPGAAKRAPRLMLHASRLAFRHPVSGNEVVIESPLPADFREALRKARERRSDDHR
jgi:RluA family pseudouridine synthase